MHIVGLDQTITNFKMACVVSGSFTFADREQWLVFLVKLERDTDSHTLRFHHVSVQFPFWLNSVTFDPITYKPHTWKMAHY